MVETPVWEKQPHTEAKHEILRRYLGAWFGIMSQHNSRIVYLDGFAGPGIYSDGSQGSPVLALQTLLDHRAFRPGTEYVFIFNEYDSDRFAELGRQLAQIQRPSNVKVYLESETFETKATALVSDVQDNGGQLEPTFAFLDPFGPKGMPIHVVKDLLQSPKCELFCYLDLNHMIRFGTAGGASDSVIEQLFGTDEFKQAPRSGAERRDYFIHLYEEQLRSLCGFTYTLSFTMTGQNNKPICAMVYATRSILGMEKMKDAMWRVDGSGEYTFSDRTANMDPLFESEPSFDQLAQDIWHQFIGCTVDVKEIERFVIGRTAFAKSHTRAALKILEQESKLTVAGVNGHKRRKSTFPPETVQLAFS